MLFRRHYKEGGVKDFVVVRVDEDVWLTAEERVPKGGTLEGVVEGCGE